MYPASNEVAGGGRELCRRRGVRKKTELTHPLRAAAGARLGDGGCGLAGGLLNGV